MPINFYSITSFDEIEEFHNIMPIENIPSIMINGILSYDLANEIEHSSVAMNVVQNRRENVKVPNGLQLHQYANMYFHARNPMLFKRRNDDICIIRIDKEICQLSNVVFADRNASSDYVEFLDLHQVALLDYNYIFAQDWRDDDQYKYFEKRSKKCAEVLIPNSVEYQYVIGIYVKNDRDKNRLQQFGFDKLITINKDLFFL